MNLDRIGFVGTGRMGAPMARRLIDAGHRLIVYDRSAEATAALEAEGAEVAASPRAVADAAECVFLSLPTPEILRDVALGKDGICEGGLVRCVVDLSTTGPAMLREVARELREGGVRTLDCPISGGVAGAQKGTLALMAAGERELYDTLQPVLANFGRVFHVGVEPGMGQMMKLINNLMSVTALAISSEALVLGTKVGLDPDQMIEVINSGSGANNAAADKIPKYVLPRTFDFGFAIGLSSKDLRLCLEEGAAQGVPMLVGGAVRQLLAIAMARNGGEADLTTLITPIEDWARTEVRGKSAPKA